MGDVPGTALIHRFYLLSKHSSAFSCRWEFAENIIYLLRQDEITNDYNHYTYRYISIGIGMLTDIPGFNTKMMIEREREILLQYYSTISIAFVLNLQRQRRHVLTPSCVKEGTILYLKIRSPKTLKQIYCLKRVYL